MQAKWDSVGQVEVHVGGKALISELASLPLAIAGPDSVTQPPQGADSTQRSQQGKQRLQITREHRELNNDWQLQEQIGQGSFGEVWQAIRHSGFPPGDCITPSPKRPHAPDDLAE